VNFSTRGIGISKDGHQVFTDYLLLKSEEGWKIAAKVYIAASDVGRGP
jgi:hypothetical protein